jgi:hypothetical protein
VGTNLGDGKADASVCRIVYPAFRARLAPNQHFGQRAAAAHRIEPALEQTARQIVRRRGFLRGVLRPAGGAEHRQRGFKVLPRHPRGKSSPAPKSLHQNGEAQEQRQTAREKGSRRNHALCLSSPLEKRKRLTCYLSAIAPMEKHFSTPSSGPTMIICLDPASPFGNMNHIRKTFDPCRQKLCQHDFGNAGGRFAGAWRAINADAFLPLNFRAAAARFTPPHRSPLKNFSTLQSKNQAKLRYQELIGEVVPRAGFALNPKKLLFIKTL